MCHLTILSRLLFTMFILLSATLVQAALPPTLEKAQIDWVCVTDATLVEAYAPLAAHRQAQDLKTLVLSLDEVILWSPAGEDTMATLRWLSGVAAEQWGAQYLLLGGSHALLPAPIHRLFTPHWSYDHPTDAYYSCLDGEWDVDGDGLVAEWDEDAADPSVHIILGRLPADDLQSVDNVVAKIIAFERRPEELTDRALFVSSLMDPLWEFGDPYPNHFMESVMALQDTAVMLKPDLQTSTLFQGNDPIDPLYDILNPISLAEGLRYAPHDLVHFQLNGISRAWELAGYVHFLNEHCGPLAGSGHSFLATMTTGSVGDTREENILQTLLTMPDGGAVGAIVPIGMGYYIPQRYFRDWLWRRLLDGNNDRLGQAFVGALEAYQTEMNPTSGNASTYWTLAILGDPATLLRPMEVVVPVPPAARVMDLRAVPNPFNPETLISFEVGGSEGSGQLVRVEVFDIKGRLVDTLLEQELSAGLHSVSWNGGDSGSGVYFARVTVGKFQSMVKMTLLK